MKRIALALCLLFTLLTPSLCLAFDHIVISEVLYDPKGTETGGEAVEIYNPTDSAINISGFYIKTESSATDATIPAGTIMAAHSYYLVADAGWSTLKDNATWSAADHEEAITMSNTDAGVAVTYSNGTIIDAVGWGNPSGIGAGLYEGTPAPHVTEGKSLKRIDLQTDTNSNAADFIDSIPDPQNSTITSGENTSLEDGSNLEINVEVTNNAPSVNSATIDIDDDNTISGIQVIPVPEDIKSVPISAIITDTDGIETIESVIATINGPEGQKIIELNLAEQMSNTTAKYNSTAQMEFYDAPGTYTLTITAQDSSVNASNTPLTFEYLSMTAISIDATSLQFSGARPGNSVEARGDYALSTTSSPTIRNTGNTVLDIGIYGTDLTDGAKSILITNMKYSFDNDFASSMSGTIQNTLQTKTIGLEPSDESVVGIGFKLSIPSSTQNGNYTGQVTIVAMSG